LRRPLPGFKPAPVAVFGLRKRHAYGDHQLDHTRPDRRVHWEQDRRQGQGFWLNIVLGIVGALVGGFLFDLFGAGGVTGLNIYSMIIAIVGSVVVLLIYNTLTGPRSSV